MKYPNPTFLQKASKIKHTRRNRAIAIIAIVAVVTFVCIFIGRVAAMQDKYRELYPELVGAATSTRASTESSEEETTTTTTEETTTTEATTLGPVPVIATTEETSETSEIIITDEEGNVVTTTTVQNNNPDSFVILDDVYFANSYPLQTITHDERAVYLDNLKQLVQDYIRDYSSAARISFRYINLRNNEELGLNDLYPIVPAAAYILPLEIAMWEKVAEGHLSLNSVSTYDGSNPGNSSYIAETYSPGKQFYTRNVAYLAISRNDNVAIGYVIDRLGGIDQAYNRISAISSYIGYTNDVLYTDYQGVQQTGTNRTSIYDMANYAEYLYNGYINRPEVFQNMINDMAASEIPTPYTTAFGTNALILHAAGRNVEMNAYTDVAIIDCEEPIVVAISVECDGYDQANTIIADLATYVSRYISACHN